MKLNPVFSAICIAASISLSPMSQATIITETTDASNFIASAMNVGSDVTQIFGEISNGQDTDLFKYTLTTNTILTIEAMQIGPDLDMNLLVFNSLGQALAGDDDDDEGCNAVSLLDSLDSCLTLNLSAGDYYFGVGDNNMGAFTSIDAFNNDDDFFDNDDGILSSPSSEVAFLIGPEGGPLDDNDVGEYQINLFTTKVPEPAGLALFAAGLLAFGKRRKK